MQTSININPVLENYNNVINFLLICFLSLTLQMAFQYLLLSDNLYFNASQTQFSYKRVESLLNQDIKWQWVSHTIIPAP
jgi:hypothetical protein